MEILLNGNNMNTSTTSESKKPLIARSVISYVLVAMLVITAVATATDTFPAGNGLMTIFWPLSMFALANYWLHLYLDEHSYLEENVTASLRLHPFHRGIFLTPAL